MCNKLTIIKSAGEHTTPVSNPEIMYRKEEGVDDHLLGKMMLLQDDHNHLKILVQDMGT